MLGPTSEALVRITIDLGVREPGLGGVEPLEGSLAPGADGARFLLGGLTILCCRSIHGVQQYYS